LQHQREWLGKMDRPQPAGSMASSIEAKSVEAGSSSLSRRRGIASDSGRGKPVGAVVAATNVLRALHGSERPLNASEVARAAGLHRGTAYPPDTAS
jgi:hypothetical protein